MRLQRFHFRAGQFALILVTLAVTGYVVADDSPGLAVGQNAPKFQLPDQDGQLRSLDDLLKKNQHVAIVFYRSADW